MTDRVCEDVLECVTKSCLQLEVSGKLTITMQNKFLEFQEAMIHGREEARNGGRPTTPGSQTISILVVEDEVERRRLLTTSAAKPVCK